jgi:hypothetical protein
MDAGMDEIDFTGAPDGRPAVWEEGGGLSCAQSGFVVQETCPVVVMPYFL